MRIRTGSLWGMFGSSASRVIQFLGTLILARMLMPEDFGIVTAVQSVTGLVGMAVTTGWGQALVRREKLDDLTCHSVFSFQLIFLSAALLLLWVCAPQLAALLGDARYEPFIPVAALALLTRPFQTVSNALLVRRTAFRRIAMIGTITAFSSFPVTIPLAWLGFGAWSLVIGQLTASTIAAVAFTVSASYRPRLAFYWRRFLEVFRLSHRLAGVAMLDYLANWGPFALLSRTAGPAAVGLYQRGLATAQIPTELAGASLHPPLFRAFTGAQSEQERQRHFLRAVSAAMLYLWPCACLLHAYSHDLVLLLYGKNWEAASTVLSIVAWFVLAYSFISPCRALLTSTSDLRSLLVVRLVSTLSLLFLVWKTSGSGLAPLSWSFVLVSSLEAMTLMKLSLARIHLSGKALLRTLVPPAWGTVMFFLFEAIVPKPEHLALSLAHMGAAGLLYLVSALSLRGWNPEADYLRSLVTRQASPRRRNG